VDTKRPVFQGPCLAYALLYVTPEDAPMLNMAITFFVVAIIAALLGFGGVAGMSANIGWLLAVLGVVVLAIGLLGRAIGGGRSALP
jgi:uncharacterized membrane protein YtjA (UPF0391 family)